VDQLPRPLQEVARELSTLPGLGPKSALRIALVLLKWPRERTVELGRAIENLRDRLHICSRCAGVAESDPCAICADPGRSRETLCLVSEWDSVLTLEESGAYKGQYLVLGGLLAPLDGVEPQHLELDRLKARLREGEVREIVLALGTTLDAEATASYVKNLVDKDFPSVRVTRLAQGMPRGSEVKHMDKETLRQSLTYRQDI
jgi:recombination protein RecR